MKKNEKLALEAIKTMLNQDAKLGLTIHDKPEIDNDDSAERGYEYLHNTIDGMFEIKAAELDHADGVTQAFRKIHSYKYVDDPSFAVAMKKEMVAQGIPAGEREKAIGFIDKIINELKTDGDWDEKDSGFNPNLDEVKDVSRPEQPIDMKVEREQKSNVKWDKGNASPDRTPSD